MVLHCMYCTESVVVLYLIRTGLVKGRLVEPWLWVGIPISTLVGERGVCISAQYKHNITYSVDYMGNINQYGIPISTLVGERGVCISAQYKT